MIREIFIFKPEDFSNGFFKQEDKLFFDFVTEWETLFHAKHTPLFANCMLTNQTSMWIMEKCFQTNENEEWGMPLLDGKIDLETCITIDRIRNADVTYAVGSRCTGNEMLPLYLVIDDTIPNGKVILAYNPDFGSKSDQEPIPANVNEFVKQN